jgi:spore germination protein KA
MSGILKKLVGQKQRKKMPRRGKASAEKATEQQYGPEDLADVRISYRLDENISFLKSVLGQNNDVVFRDFRLGTAERTEAAVVFVDGMIEKNLISSEIIKPLMLESSLDGMGPNVKNLPYLVKELNLTASSVKEHILVKDLVPSLLYGNAILFIDGLGTAFSMDVKGWNSRNVEEPQSEVLVRGPREGFTETLRTNTTLIRRKLRTTSLCFKEMQVGRLSDTLVSVVYITGVADPSLVEEVVSRLARIDIDGILESGYLEELIEDAPYSPFPQILHTERPDRVAAALLEGRVAILTDGTPFALVVPGEFVSFMQSPDDYYERFFLGTAIRWLRYAAFAMSLLLPSLYIAITTFHQEMIPTRLLISLAASREGVPFPALVEALLMEFTFEALREAGIRLPRAVGQAVSIVGALVIGQSAVQAGIVSPLMVIVVAVTGIASFMNPTFSLAISMRLLRFPMMLLAGTLGLFGVMAGILALLIHLAGLRSFGVPYLASLAPFHAGDMKDVAIRAPWWAMDRRPQETGKENSRRQAPGLKPSPPEPEKS